MIPKIIHQIWYQGEDIPIKYQKWQSSWKEKHPAWEYFLWTESKMKDILREEKYRWFLPTWDGYPLMIQRIDAFKWILLDKFGGYYTDLDTEPIAPLDGLLLPDCEFALVGFRPFYKFWAKFIGYDLVVNNCFIASKSDNPLLLEFLKDYETIYRKYLKDEVMLNSVMRTTGPIAVSQTVSRSIGKCKMTILDPRSVEIYPMELERYRKGGYIVHHSENTWAKKNSVLNLLNASNTTPTMTVFIVLMFVIFLILLAVLVFAVVKLQECRKVCPLK